MNLEFSEKVIYLFAINLTFGALFFSPFISIINRKKTMKRAKAFVWGRYQNFRFLATMSLLLVFSLLLFLVMEDIIYVKMANAFVIFIIGIIFLKVITFSSKDYEN